MKATKRRKRMESSDGGWQELVPHHNPPGVPPGWYFVHETRDGEQISAGPYESKEFCERVLATAKPCHTCKTLCFHDEFEDPITEAARDAQAKAGTYATLCPDCQFEFVEWHTKEHGKPPTPAGRQ